MRTPCAYPRYNWRINVGFPVHSCFLIELWQHSVGHNRVPRLSVLDHRTFARNAVEIFLWENIKIWKAWFEIQTEIATWEHSIPSHFPPRLSYLSSNLLMIWHPTMWPGAASHVVCISILKVKGVFDSSTPTFTIQYAKKRNLNGVPVPACQSSDY